MLRPWHGHSARKDCTGGTEHCRYQKSTPEPISSLRQLSGESRLSITEIFQLTYVVMLRPVKTNDRFIRDNGHTQPRDSVRNSVRNGVRNGEQENVKRGEALLLVPILKMRCGPMATNYWARRSTFACAHSSGVLTLKNDCKVGSKRRNSASGT